MPVVVSPSGRLHSEFVRLLFIQIHRETDRFLRVDLTLTKETVLRVNLSSSLAFYCHSKKG
jgi:hypothetical protein